MREERICSAFKFFDMLNKNIQAKRNYGRDSVYFYRGHADKYWHLVPSITRINLLKLEKEMINEFKRIRPDEFPDSLGMFDTIAKMQHYGMNTRLLDVSSNPAVALYFSCCDLFYDNKIKDGEVFVFDTLLKEIPDNTVANLILDFYINEVDENGGFNISEYYKKQLAVFSKKIIDKLFWHVFKEGTCIVRPKIISERMIRQYGAFILLKNSIKTDIDCEENAHNIIKNCEKNETTVDWEKQYKNIIIKDEIEDITQSHILNSQSGIRYIIDAESKEKILNELETIGINSAFLFPDLQHESEKIIYNYLKRYR